MRTGISFTVSAGERQRLQAIVAAPRSPQTHVWRARIVLLSADGLGTSAIMAETNKSKTCVWRWQERLMQEGVDGLLRDRSHPPGTAPVASDRVAAIIRLTLEPPPHEVTGQPAFINQCLVKLQIKFSVAVERDLASGGPFGEALFDSGVSKRWLGMQDIFYSAFTFVADAFWFPSFEGSRLAFLNVDPEFSAGLLGIAAFHARQLFQRFE